MANNYHNSSFLPVSAPLLGDAPTLDPSFPNANPLELDSDAQACRFFDDLDLNKDKILSKKEFVDGLLAAQIDITEVEALRLFAKIASSLRESEEEEEKEPNRRDQSDNKDISTTEFVTQQNFLKVSSSRFQLCTHFKNMRQAHISKLV